ncbi:uncharacterized protein PAC_14038 [Phialocephala subalpina]|uniref:Tetraspanin Tsp3 n=1 Tax=Phialocephala subalpina TaxID=576137 RepID=A0A1L7XGI4_9HELO|nr:uncharacterized protein PAC_14038 [Phialocephala subalpina]
MSLLTKIVVLAIPLLFLLLTALAGYAYSQIRFLSLPISSALALFTVVLPLITGISTQGVRGLIVRSSKNEQYQLTIPLIAVIGFQLIYETVVATLALTYILPPSSLNCGLRTKWMALYKAKDADAIRTIQDAFNCCGFNSVKDMAFPFRNQAASECAQTFHRTESCVGPWRKAEQMNAGWLLFVAVIVFSVKVLSILSLLTNTSWTHPPWGRRYRREVDGDAEEPEEDNGALTRRLIEENANDEGYHDEENEPAVGTLEAPSGDRDQGPRVEPSQLIEGHGNEWHDEGHTSNT